MQRICQHRYILLALIAFTIYVSFMSIGLDDFDSHTFALAIENPGAALVTVHAPGFPIYLFISKLIQLIVGDTRLALTLMSAISGAIGIVFVAKIGALAAGEKAGFISAGLLLFSPGYWVNSEVALSDIPGISFTVLAVFLFLRAQEKRTALDLVAGCFVTGLLLGVRPHSAIPIVIAGVWAIVKMRQLSRVYFQSIALGAIAGLLAISMWLIPIASAFNGLDGYVNHIDTHRKHVLSSDSLFKSEINSDTLSLRAQAFVDGWIYLLAGGDTYAIILILILFTVGLIKAPINSRYTLFFIVWFIAEVCKIFLLVSLERPRLFLPALVPLILWVGLGYAHWRGRFRLLGSGLILLVITFLWQALPLVVVLTQIPPPPAQAASYILTNYPQSDDAHIVSKGSFRALQYHLKEYRQLYTHFFTAERLAQSIATAQPKYLIVLDVDSFTPEKYDALNYELNYVKIDDHLFERDARIFPQHATVSLQVFTPEQNLKSDLLHLLEAKLETRQIEVGNPHDAMYFSKGWYSTENIGGVWGRWATQSASIRITLEPRDTFMRFVSAPYLPNQMVTLSVNDEFVDTVAIDAIWGDYEIMIPADAIQSGINTITLAHAKAEYPENHHRRLAAAYRSIHFDWIASD